MSVFIQHNFAGSYFVAIVYVCVCVCVCKFEFKFQILAVLRTTSSSPTSVLSLQKGLRIFSIHSFIVRCSWSKKNKELKQPCQTIDRQKDSVAIMPPWLAFMLAVPEKVKKNPNKIQNSMLRGTCMCVCVCVCVYVLWTMNNALEANGSNDRGSKRRPPLAIVCCSDSVFAQLTHSISGRCLCSSLLYLAAASVVALHHIHDALHNPQTQTLLHCCCWWWTISNVLKR